MLYLLCLVCPPLAVLFAGRPGSALLNLLLTCLGWLPGVVHAFFVVGDAKADKRTKVLAKEIRRAGGG